MPPPGYGMTPGYAPRPAPSRTPKWLIISAIGVVVVLGGALIGLRVLVSVKSSENDSGPLAYPAVGTCIDHHGGDVMHESIPALDCANPAATKKIVASEIVIASIRDYTYDPACADGSSRFDRIVRGVQDTEVCETPTEDAGRRMDMILIGKFHFVHKEENATYCFALPN